MAAAPRPPEEGEGLLHVFLTRENVPRGVGQELGLAVVIGKQEAVSAGRTPFGAVVGKQLERLKGFAREIAESPSDELRKRLVAWVHCFCPLSTTCQGGEEPCVRCSTCAGMGMHAGASNWRGWPSLPKMDRERGADMNAMCPPKNVCLLVDVSGSMEEEDKLAQMKGAIKESLRHYMAGDVFSLVAFADRPRLVIPPTLLRADLEGLQESRVPLLMSSPLPVERVIREQPDSGMGKVLRGFLEQIDGLRAGGRTNIHAALRTASEALQMTEAQRGLLRDPRAINRILLFTDGMHHARRASPAVLSDFSSLAADLCKAGLSISTFGVGRDGFDEGLLTELVAPKLHHSGAYYYVTEPAQVRELLWDDLMATPRAREARLTIDLLEGVRGSGPPSARSYVEEDGTRVVANLRTIALEEKRTHALRLRVPGGAVRLARVRLEYRDQAGVPRFEEVEVRVRRVPTGSKALPLSRQNLVALEELVIQETRDALARAVAHLDGGNASEAAAALTEQIRHLEGLQDMMGG